MKSDEPRRHFLAVVARIPRGRVATYGQVAAIAGLPGRARQVGYALSSLVDTKIPWHRVINSAGKISSRREPGADLIQRTLLEREGVRFDADQRVDLDKYQWHPRASTTAAQIRHLRKLCTSSNRSKSQQ